jgi:predicted transcriptional regulator
MLERLLNEIRKGGTLQPGMLAERLNLSTAMVEAMLADLERRGMLQQVDTRCSEPCGGCPLVSSCSTGDRGRLWMLARSKPA